MFHLGNHVLKNTNVEVLQVVEKLSIGEILQTMVQITVPIRHVKHHSVGIGVLLRHFLIDQKGTY